MIRWLLWLLFGIALGGVVHLVTVLALPRFAEQSAYARLVPVSPVNAMVQLPAPAADSTLLPLMDPAFAESVCRYDLGEGPLKFVVPVTQAYTSLSFYTREGVAYYAINDRAAGRRIIELDLMTADQRAELPENDEMTAADRLIVESPGETGLVLVRALAPEPGFMPMVRETLAKARCEASPPAQDKNG
ncbi:MAG TPA: DUF1254 domain-containing protein [Xanthobacteraceae bacterium]|nr:DUF1254 domain-containing protein [Xanthobacteraceae bacterium]